MIALVLISMLAAHNNISLPQWMTPEESLRVHEIGKTHIVTPPPSGWVATPGEFEQLKGVFITWRYGFGSNQDRIFRDIVREVVEISRSYIIVISISEQNTIAGYLTAGGVPLDSVQFMIFPSNSMWIRDYGPWFMRTDDTEGIVDFIYNRPRPEDDTIPWRIGDAWGVPVYGSPLTHAGGNFMVDGLGTGFASDLIYEENAGYTPTEIATAMREYNGIEQFVVMPRIALEYTHHIDLWAKILNDTLVMVGEYAPGHPNHDILDNNADSISRCVNGEGIPYRIVRMPMPWSISDAPPSYLNSLIVEPKVLVPLWNMAEDDTALFIYQQVLPDHEIVGIDCSSMAGLGGAIHCITMQVPSSQFLHVKHAPLKNTNDTINDYRVRAQVLTSDTLYADSTLVFYRINDGLYSIVPLSAVNDTPGVYEGYIPAQSIGDTVHYYIQAYNNYVKRTSPNHAPLHAYSFRIDSMPGVNECAATTSIDAFSVVPNPSHTSVAFVAHVSSATNVKIEIYNVLGQKVRVIVNNCQNQGTQKIVWNLRDAANKQLPQGTYLYRAIANEVIETGTLVILH